MLRARRTLVPRPAGPAGGQAGAQAPRRARVEACMDANDGGMSSLSKAFTQWHGARAVFGANCWAQSWAQSAPSRRRVALARANSLPSSRAVHGRASRGEYVCLWLRAGQQVVFANLTGQGPGCQTVGAVRWHACADKVQCGTQGLGCRGGPVLQEWPPCLTPAHAAQNLRARVAGRGGRRHAGTCLRARGRALGPFCLPAII
jgi:hypothetical protein